MSIVTFTDKSLMPMGQYKGIPLVNVPANTLLWYWNQNWFDKTTPLGRYISANLDVLKLQDKRDKQLKR